jgi:hypothetical protein
MSEITRVYKYGAITGAALLAASTLVAVVGAALGA